MTSSPGIASSDITPKSVFERRRRFIRVAAGALLGTTVQPSTAAERLADIVASPYSVSETVTPSKDASRYGNYLEFSSDKTEPAELASVMRTRPWTVTVDGLVAKPRTFAVEDILRLSPLEERIYRHRCVEGWSMVIPWLGFPLHSLLKRVEPLGSAKFVEFVSHADPEIMPNVGRRLLDWPYLEGLRLDEAMHPLTLLAVGFYGELLPNQNGAPLRLVVPWKYGFKGAKAIVKIRVVEQQPRTAWMKAAPDEYGFYANVNPQVDHARWSQRRERRIGEFLKRDTLMFNGYGAQVAGLYAGMDLRRNY